MKTNICLAVAWSALLAAGCATNPVPVVSPTGDAARLQGEWGGAYWSPDTQRHGSISFILGTEADTAFGEVVMIPHQDPFHPLDEDLQHRESEMRIDEVLMIRFVRIAGDSVTGELTLYQDPVCGCELRTTFIGMLESDVIDGTYRSQHSSGMVHRGEWRVVRRR
jgi:hypothetical protein